MCVYIPFQALTALSVAHFHAVTFLWPVSILIKYIYIDKIYASIQPISSQIHIHIFAAGETHGKNVVIEQNMLIQYPLSSAHTEHEANIFARISLLLFPLILFILIFIILTVIYIASSIHQIPILPYQCWINCSIVAYTYTLIQFDYVTLLNIYIPSLLHFFFGTEFQMRPHTQYIPHPHPHITYSISYVYINIYIIKYTHYKSFLFVLYYYYIYILLFVISLLLCFTLSSSPPSPIYKYLLWHKHTFGLSLLYIFP